MLDSTVLLFVRHKLEECWSIKGKHSDPHPLSTPTTDATNITDALATAFLPLPSQTLLIEATAVISYSPF
jgi:hypothetical protein